ncbi:polynucleotide adenylyltransferase [Halomonas garicola]|uniref:polynucleotide adenylyltransferase n=1 Tax=Halomonas garicola TaxID=1690008 RepID=UPI00289A74C1|nr:polynucleotide adenylyltransferase [Halomonas garicola]
MPRPKASKPAPEAGLEVYRVGGAVRDALLGRPVWDNDWVVVGATPEEMRRRGFKPVGRDFPVFLHPESAEEYALARTERKAGHGYSGFTVHSSPDVTLKDDLVRRDLTINAIAEAPGGTLVDPYGGRDDLERRVLRHVSAAFAEDPLRVLRTARFLARYAHLGFTVAPDTRALMREVSRSGELSHLAAERVWTESEKALGEQSPDAYFKALAECEALAVWWAEIAAAPGSVPESRLDACLAAMQTVPDWPAIALSHWRYARLVTPLSDAEREALAARLKLPRAVAQLARQSAATARLVGEPLTTQAVMAWLDGQDSWRKPERARAQLALVKVLAPERRHAVLEAALDGAAAVSPQALMAEGYRGAALGRQIGIVRREAVARALGDAG